MISQHLQLLKNAPSLTSPPHLLQSTLMLGASCPLFRLHSHGASNGDNVHLPPPTPVGGRSSLGPLREGPLSPVVLNKSCHIPSHMSLTLMDVDHPPHPCNLSGPHDLLTHGLACHVLHHSIPQLQVPTEELSTSDSPPCPPCAHSPGPKFQTCFPSSHQMVGPAMPTAAHSPYPCENFHQSECVMPWEPSRPPLEHLVTGNGANQSTLVTICSNHTTRRVPLVLTMVVPIQWKYPLILPSAHHTAHHACTFWESKPPSGPPGSPLSPCFFQRHFISFPVNSYSAHSSIHQSPIWVNPECILSLCLIPAFSEF